MIAEPDLAVRQQIASSGRVSRCQLLWRSASVVIAGQELQRPVQIARALQCGSDVDARRAADRPAPPGC